MSLYQNSESEQKMKSKLKLGIVLAVFFPAAILIANYATSTLGFLPVGFGYRATAGTFAAGLILALRDGIQDALGRRIIFLLILTGAALSFFMSAPAIATASAAAFLISETVDFTIYTPLRKKSKLGDSRWLAAVVLANLAGALTDTIVFLGIAFGSAAIAPALPGQLIGKGWATLVYLMIGWVVSLAISRKSMWTNGGRINA
jgi:hypothetical protein